MFVKIFTKSISNIYSFTCDISNSVRNKFRNKSDNNQESYVYIIRQNTEPPVFKIGKANNVHKRIKMLQTGNPNILTIELIISSNIPFELERQLHKYFTKYRIRSTEWFNIELNQIKSIKKILKKYKQINTSDVINNFIIDINDDINKNNKYHIYKNLLKSEVNINDKNINDKNINNNINDNINDKNINNNINDNINDNNENNNENSDISNNWIMIYAEGMRKSFGYMAFQN